MNEKQKAVELINDFKDHVNPYMGSGMLSNTYDDNAILYQSKMCAKKAVGQIMRNCIRNGEQLTYWGVVLVEIDNTTVEDVNP